MDEVDADRVLALLKRLSESRGAPLNPYDDSYVKDKEGYQLIRVAGGPSKAATSFLFKSRFAPPDSILGMMHSFTTGLAVAWQQGPQ